MDNSSSAESVAKHLRDHDTVASDKFAAFKQRLWLVARQHLNTQLRARVDLEDVVQSAVGTFFNHLDAAQGPARVGDTVLNGWNDVEDLLVRLTINKCRKKWEQATAGKRDVTRTTSLTTDIDIAREPRPRATGSSFSKWFRSSTAAVRTKSALLNLIQQGVTQTEVARRLGVSQPLISLKIRHMVARLRNQLDGVPDP